MNGLFLLYGLTYVPVTAGNYTAAVDEARTAAFMQSGLKTQWEAADKCAEKHVPVIVFLAAGAASAIQHKQLEVRLQNYGTWSVNNSGLKTTFSWGF